MLGLKLNHVSKRGPRASRVDALYSLRIDMEYYLLNMYLKATICHIIMAKFHFIL